MLVSSSLLIPFHNIGIFTISILTIHEHGSVSSPLIGALGFLTCAPAPSFHMGSGNLNSVPHIWVASGLPTELFSQPQSTQA